MPGFAGYRSAAEPCNTRPAGKRRLNRLTYSGSSDALSEAANYDAGGNISNLTRLGTSAATLAYTYRSGNQLGSVTNGGAAFRSYSYDGNGNATTDGGLSAAAKTISYNLLNLPQSVSQNGTTLATYTYAADGEKLRNSGSDGYWDYDGGIVYNGTTSSNGTIQFIQTEEGRAVPQGNSWNYTYDLKDHLGNVRLSFDKNPSTGAARRIQEDEYYAFGLRSAVYNNLNNNRYLYNGKELQTDLQNQYDYGARFYDPVIARWSTIDPLAEVSRRWSPYNYVENNPVRLTDPDGMAVNFDKWGNPIYDNVGTPDALNYALGLQAFTRKTVSNALGFAGLGGGKTNNNDSKVSPPKDGDKNKKGQIYSGVLKAWVTPELFEHTRINLLQRKFDYENQTKAAENDKSYAIKMFFGSIAGMIFYELGILSIDMVTKAEPNPYSDLDFSDLQTAVKKDSKPMNVFFDSQGQADVDRSALQKYKELLERILDKRGGAYQNVTPRQYQIYKQRLEWINQALNGR